MNHEDNSNQIGKKKVKGEIKFNLNLNDEQKIAKQVILDNKITIVRGAAGCGKTLMSVQIALDLLFRKEISKVIIARPMVTSGEDMGYLPGGVAEKTKEYLIPIYDNMYQLYDKTKVENLIQEGRIEICPLGMLRGRTFVDAFVIIDESQNLTHQQCEGMLSRIGKGSKMVLCGDINQCDLVPKTKSGFPFLKRLEGIKGFALVTLLKNHRDEIVEEILKVYAEMRD